MINIKITFSFLVFFCYVLIYGSLGFSQEFLNLKSASEGLPNVAEHLSEESFVKITAKRLKKAQVLWVNRELLEEMHIRTPDGELTDEFNEKILDEWAYLIPRETDRPEDFLPQEKIFYADRYGGSGLGHSEGSGRAAGAGLFQVKGIGRTPLVSKVKETVKPKKFTLLGIFQYIWDRFSIDNHNHGGATLREAMAEAVWGEILHKELPYGANRVAFIIGTRRSIGLAKVPQALIVRENSLRPAHYIRNDNRPMDEEKAEETRIKNLIEPFSKLPIIAKDKSNKLGDRLNLVLKEIFDRVGRKYGTEYVHSFFHGSSSPSNIELTGRALDHGPMTALDGFTKALNVDDYPNGDIRVLFEDILGELRADLEAMVPAKYQDSIPSALEMEKIVKKSYNLQIKKELLWRLGLPPELAQQIVSTRTGTQLAKEILSLAQAGNDDIIFTKKKAPFGTGLYDFNKIMIILSSNTSAFEKQNSLSKIIPDWKVRESLLEKHENMHKTLQKHLNNENHYENILKYIDLASRQRNRTFADLMRGGRMFFKQYLQIVIWTLTRLSSPISNYINGTVKKYERSPEIFSNNDLVIDSITDKKTSSTIRKVFDGNTGKSKVEIIAYAHKNTIRFFDSEIVTGNLHEGRILQTESDQVPIERVLRQDNKIVMVFETENLKLSDFKTTSLSRKRYRPLALQCSALFANY